MEAGLAQAMAEVARRLAEQGILRGDLGVEDAADLQWVLTAFEAFDLLSTGRSHSPDRVADTLVTTADRSLCS
jgi:hypothetical protein